ncbi:MAG: TM1802 family CRISPR-associated protein [Rubrobacteraceae bacterium]
MLEAMSQLALDFLREELPDDAGDTSEPWGWYLEVREERSELLFPFLVEAARDSMAPNHYLLKADPENPDTAVLEQREFRRGEDEAKLPFVQSTGSQSPALGPIIKRSFSKQKGGGPSGKILDSTLKEFREIGEGNESWSPYFAGAAEVASRPRMRFQNQTFEEGSSSALEMAVKHIPENRTCYLSIPDNDGNLPGEIEEYKAYLTDILASEKYSTGKIAPITDGVCALSGDRGVVYPNGLSGSGLNLSNVDRPGVFPGIDDQGAWKKFPLSAAGADLLYIFSFHIRDRFIAQVAGERALLIPYTTLDPEKRLKFMKRTRDRYVPQTSGESVVRQEKKLQSLADEEGVVTSITILWADFGQKLENVRGIVTDVLPSRLRAVSGVAGVVDPDENYPFPEHPCFHLDVGFNQLGALLRRPGGKRTEKANSGARLSDLRRDIAANSYHGREIPLERFREEVREISEAYLIEALERGSYGLVNEGVSRKGEPYLTMAGWARHLCKFIYFLRRLEVYPRMDDWRYKSHNERLTEFFQDPDGRTGIDSPEKAYAFLLGALFGKLIQVQGSRGVNVGSNALTWLRRLTLTGKDLPELYVRIREKLLTYGTESSSNVRDVIEELGHLGRSLGMDIKLNQTETGYFLLLGQSLSRTVMPAREKEEVAE